MAVMTAKGTILSLPDAIGQILEEHARSTSTMESMPTVSVEQVSVAVDISVESTSAEVGKKTDVKAIADFGFMPGCPDCGNALVMSEGCISCKNCGFSRCL